MIPGAVNFARTRCLPKTGTVSILEPCDCILKKKWELFWDSWNILVNNLFLIMKDS